MSESKKHHYVPRFYLTGFTEPGTPDGLEPWLWHLGRGATAWKKRAPANVGFAAHFYRLDEPGPELDPLAAERLLSTIESNAKRAFDDLGSKRVLGLDKQKDFASFVAMMIGRSPMVRAIIETRLLAAGERLVDKVIDGWERNPTSFEEKSREFAERKGVPMAALTLDSFKSRKPRLVPPPDVIRVGGFTMYAKAMEWLLELDWQVAVTSGDDYFITSDLPVAVINPNRPERHFAGFFDPEAELSFPINRHMALMGLHGNRRRSWWTPDRDWIAEINLRTYASGMGEAFAPSMVFPGVERVEGLHGGIAGR
jgi:Protein of unknown function (DUF4238)